MAAGGKAQVNSDDMCSWAGAKAVIDQAVESLGYLDILVNNAGILRDKMSFNMDESDWDDVIRVHLKGHFAPSHFAASHWRDRAKAGEHVSGRIINTASEAGLFGNAGQANYGAAKAGIARMTIILGRELGRYGVTVNAISPRARTRMTEDLFGEMAKAEEGKFDAFGPRERRPAGGLPRHRRGGGRERPELRRVRRQHLRPGLPPARGGAASGPRLDAGRARRGQGGTLQEPLTGRPEVQLLLIPG